MELRLEVRTRVDVSRDQHEIQVISVRNAGVLFKVIQSPDASCYSGSAQHYSKEYRKARLQKRYGDELILHMPTARFKPELVYGSTIVVQDILNAWAELQSKKEEERIENEIFLEVKTSSKKYQKLEEFALRHLTSTM